MATRADFPVLVPGFDSFPQLHTAITKQAVEQLRQTIGLKDNGNPCPRLIAHDSYHLDEVWAALLLRALHRTDTEMEPLRELIQRDETLSFTLHPEIRNSILIGIGGDSPEKIMDNVVVYDEHSKGNERLAASASRLVVQKIIADNATNITAIEPMIKEVDDIDQHGDKAGGEAHLSKLIKSLHWTNTCDGDSLDRIGTGHKEAIIAASIAVVATAIPELVQRQPSNDAVMASWARYAKAQHVFSSDTAVEYVEKLISGQSATNTTLLQLRNVAHALLDSWSMELSDYVLHTWFETWVQLQFDFEHCLEEGHHIQKFERDRLLVEWVQRRYEDKTPHRARLHLANRAKRPTLIVVYDPFVMITAIFPNNFLHKGIWERFCDRLQEREPELWYRQKDETGTRTAFILNGTRAHQEMPPSQMRPGDYIRLVPTPSPQPRNP